MKDYERYMNRQRLSETAMARLLKLETERPEKRERRPKGRSGWVKYAAMAASLVLAAGLLLPPALRGIGRLAQEGEEELFFYYVEDAPRFTSTYVSEGMEFYPQEPAEVAAIFGCAPDDFLGFLETVELDKYDMKYDVVDMANFDGDERYRLWIRGDYVSPREKPENWDEISDVSWETHLSTTSYIPANSVWLEIYEGHSYLEETDWNDLEPHPFHGHQVAAAWDGGDNVEASAAFDVVSNGKTYGVLYRASTGGERNAKELVTKLVSYLTQNGLFIEDRGVAQVKTSGLYIMETGSQDHEAIRLVPPRISFDEEGYTFGQSLLSSHWCRGSYEVADGRVTVRCEQHTYVFDIVDENTLRFVEAESSQPERYNLSPGEGATPMVTDGAVFRWQEKAEAESLVFNQVEKVPYNVQSPYDMELSGRLDVSEDEREMMIGTLERLGWTELKVAGSSWPMGRDPDTDWPNYYFTFEGIDNPEPTCTLSLRLMPNMTDFGAYLAGEVPNWYDLEVCQVNGHRVTALSGRSYTPDFYCAAAAFVIEDTVCDYGVYYAVEHEDQRTAEAMVTQLVEELTEGGVFTEMYRTCDGEGTLTLEYAELEQTYAYVDFYKALEENESRDLTKEELEAVFPVATGSAGVNYVWEGAAWFKNDGNLRAVVITGDAMDGSGTVILTTSQEADLSFTRNQVKKDGTTSYFGADNTKYVYGMDMLRCFCVNEPGHFANAPSRYDCYAQWKLTGSPLYTQVRTIVPEGLLLENETFNTRWFDEVNKTGLWFRTGNVNGADIWRLPAVKDAEAAVGVDGLDIVLAGLEARAEASGVYYQELEDGGLERNAYLNITGTAPRVRVCYGERDCLCDGGSYNADGSRVTYVCDDCGDSYAFDIVDGDTLRFAADSSSVGDLSDRTVFRHRRDGETLTTVFQWGLSSTHHPEPSHHSGHH